jgi:hypothetical protein
MKTINTSRNTRGEIVSARIDGQRVHRHHDVFVMTRSDLEDLNCTPDMEGMIIMIEPEAGPTSSHSTTLVPVISLSVEKDVFKATLTYGVAVTGDICIGCYSVGVQSIRAIRELSPLLADDGVLSSEHPDWHEEVMSHVLHFEIPTCTFSEIFAKLDMVIRAVAIATSTVQAETEAIISKAVEETAKTIKEFLRL